MKRIAIIGAGNVGLAAAKAVMLSPDMELCGFIRREAKRVSGFLGIPAAKSVFDLPKKPDGAIICLPSRLVEPVEKELLEAGIYTVDSFDIHEELPAMRRRLSAAAEKGGVSAVIGAGWDPGLDSVIRTLMLAAVPQGITYTNFGPGMSLGHSAAAREAFGVADAISFTLPVGFGKHRRKIYAVLKEGENNAAVEHGILSDGYFEHDECSVEFTDSVKPLFNTSHGVLIERSGNSAGNGSQWINFRMAIDNPSLTGQIMVSAMRACFLQKPGAYFMPEIPPCDFCGEGWEKVI
ncbi:MAG: diaminopimelate dehydrogenase [Oscillospiraceae bacterium]|nr:diaminopimelate dehydrogenase [Oscillospiraceae bacterium]